MHLLPLFRKKCSLRSFLLTLENSHRESYELGKGKKPVGNKKQAVTLRLMARVYLDWDREEHLQKALNAVVLDEALRHPDLNVQMGLNIVNLVIQYQRTASAFECLRLLANRFQNSPDLAKIQLSHLELLLNGKQTQEAKEVVEDCISGHNTGRPLDEETRKMFHILLWEKAAAFYDGKDFQEALAWYNYSLSLFTSEEKDGNKNLAKLLAREVAAESVTIDPDSPLTHFYQFKIALMEGDDELAIQTIGKMKDIGKKPQNNCVTVDSADDVHALVCLAAQLSLEQNNREVGIRALESLVKTSSSSKQIITALRCLIRLKLTLGENENRRDLGSIQSYLQTALDSINNMSCVGEDIHIEAMWFMKIAWNMALDSIETLQEMREFFLISHKFADLCPIETSNITRQKSCQLMASAASLQIAQETSDEEQKRNALKQALSHVQSCRDLCRRLSAGKQTGGKDDIAVLLVLYEFEAKVKLGESNASLESCLQKAMALPQCEAQTFETLAALAVEHPAYNKDICMKSLRIAVKKHKTSGHTDCTKLSKVYHSLVEIALNNGSSSDANSKEEAWKIYEEILDFMEGKIKFEKAPHNLESIDCLESVQNMDRGSMDRHRGPIHGLVHGPIFVDHPKI
ncbi:Testis-expressed sequence 11 protein [Exaiptasia diaphana]|nr:Testis-expressed sequence 11 protein [Exaiptasia diaphana]